MSICGALYRQLIHAPRRRCRARRPRLAPWAAVQRLATIKHALTELFQPERRIISPPSRHLTYPGFCHLADKHRVIATLDGVDQLTDNPCPVSYTHLRAH